MSSAPQFHGSSMFASTLPSSTRRAHASNATNPRPFLTDFFAASAFHGSRLGLGDDLKELSLPFDLYCTQTNSQLLYSYLVTIKLTLPFPISFVPILFLHQWHCFTLHNFGPGARWACHLKKTALYRGFDFQSIFKRLRHETAGPAAAS